MAKKKRPSKTQILSPTQWSNLGFLFLTMPIILFLFPGSYILLYVFFAELALALFFFIFHIRSQEKNRTTRRTAYPVMALLFTLVFFFYMGLFFRLDKDLFPEPSQIAEKYWGLKTPPPSKGPLPEIDKIMARQTIDLMERTIADGETVLKRGTGSANEQQYDAFLKEQDSWIKTALTVLRTNSLIQTHRGWKEWWQDSKTGFYSKVAPLTVKAPSLWPMDRQREYLYMAQRLENMKLFLNIIKKEYPADAIGLN